MGVGSKEWFQCVPIILGLVSTSIIGINTNQLAISINILSSPNWLTVSNLSLDIEVKILDITRISSSPVIRRRTLSALCSPSRG